MSELKIFGTDGIRGKPSEFPLVPSLLGKLGVAFDRLLERQGMKYANYPGGYPVLFARDTRASGKALFKQLHQGFLEGGFYPQDLGILPTPALAYLVPSLRALMGCMISASHNPPEYNGVKFFGPNGQKIPEDWEKEIEGYLFGSRFHPRRNSRPAHSPHGTQAVKLTRQHYSDFLQSQLPADMDLRGIKIVLDCGNGASYQYLPQLLRKLGAFVITRGTRPNGSNINVACGAMDPRGLCREVRRTGSHIGFALDGDADRLTVVDEQGRVLAGEWILATFALDRKARQEQGSGALVTTQVSNFALKRYLEKHQIDVLETKVGDRWVLEKLQEEGLGFGGENSGHYIWPNILPSADGSLAVMMLLNMVRRKGKKVSRVFVRFPMLAQASLQVTAPAAKPPARNPAGFS